MTATRYLTITLTGTAPVRIDCAAWPIVSQARQMIGDDLQLIVRRAADGRCLVFGIAKPIRGPQRRAGELVSTVAAPPTADKIAAALGRVADAIGAGSELANRCIVGLPADVLQ